MAVEFKGLDEVMKNLNKEIKSVKGFSRLGLEAASNLVKKEAIKKAPADTGNLRGSAYHKTTEDLVATIGFNANYALSVHENIEQKGKGNERKTGTKKGNYWDSGQPKFLENALKENTSEIVDKIKEFASF